MRRSVMAAFFAGSAVLSLAALPGANAVSPPTRDQVAAQTTAAPATKTQASRDAVKTAAMEFYAKLRDGNATQNEAAFHHPSAAVSGISRLRDARPWRKTAAEYLKGHGDAPKSLALDSVDVDMIHEGLAVAKIKYRASGLKGYAVLAFTAEKNDWRIVSLYEETFFVW